MAVKEGGLRCYSVDIPATAGVLTIPMVDAYVVTEVIMNIETALGGTDTVTVGKTGANAAFLADADVGLGAAGYYRSSEGVAVNGNGFKLGTEDLIIERIGATSGGGEVYFLLTPVVA